MNLDRDWEAEVGIEYRFRRSAQSPRFNVTLHVDPCSFLAYDLNRNGEFSKDELSAIFGKDEKPNALFAGLDMDPNDGVITEEEFLAMGPLIIADCFNNEK
ncbi:uncharacterized protein LOC132732602 [Ruditapes philippinarum]|uniref:uncharacterized protein LOC132732602 n=1 Tax=Ruditapes philippinarum TaxID=129788 RepID=UPI00295A69C5|nr:uncharacterized protein LOC132732602 [Ruditapes philippinarum]